jgi:hypothetical protein
MGVFRLKVEVPTSRHSVLRELAEKYLGNRNIIKLMEFISNIAILKVMKSYEVGGLERREKLLEISGKMEGVDKEELLEDQISMLLEARGYINEKLTELQEDSS